MRFMSLMFPTIFALGLRGMDGGTRKTAASFLVMAIIGGAVLTLLMGAISDAAGIHRAMVVPLLWCAVERRDSPVGGNPTRQVSLRPVAIGAVVEETKRPKPSVQRVT